MEDPVFQVALATFVGQPCPLMSSIKLVYMYMNISCFATGTGSRYLITTIHRRVYSTCVMVHWMRSLPSES